MNDFLARITNLSIMCIENDTRVLQKIDFENINNNYGVEKSRKKPLIFIKVLFSKQYAYYLLSNSTKLNIRTNKVTTFISFFLS